MIFAEWKPVEEIIEKLAGKGRILVVGCATCVAECAAGGEKEVDTMAPLISMGLKQKDKPAEVATVTVEKQCEFEESVDLPYSFRATMMRREASRIQIKLMEMPND